MRTDELINAIALDASRRSMRPARALGLALAAGAALAAACALALGVRPDIALALQEPRFLLKLLVTLSLAAGAWMLLERLARPAARREEALRLLVLPLGLIGLGIAAELAVLPPEFWGRALVGQNWLMCLVSIPLVSLGPLAAALLSLRKGAPLSPRLSGAAAGLAAGALGATFYAAHCTDDSPLFVATWYTLAIALTAALGGLVGARLLRW